MKAPRNSLYLIAGLACIVLCANAQAVPTYYFLITPTSEETVNGAIFMPFNPDTATGTGNFESFVRIQGDGTEIGYNTDAKTPEYQTKAGKWTHSVTVNNLTPPRVQIGTDWYREILIDINQTTGGRYLSFDQLVITLQDAPDLTGYAGVPNATFDGPVVYDMDALGDSSVIMDALLFGSGSGKGDVRIYVPDFSPDPSFPYMYVYAVFGQQTSVQLPTGEIVSAVADSGFEEMGVWASISPEIPAPGALLLVALGTGLVASLRRGRVL